MGARPVLESLATGKGWVVTGGAWSSTFSRMKRGDVTISVSWYPLGAVRDARRFVGSNQTGAINKGDIDRRKSLERWIKEPLFVLTEGEKK